MRDVFAVLRQREMDIARVRKEIEALRFVIPLLAEEATSAPEVPDVSSISSRYSNKWPLDLRPSTTT